MILVCDIGNTNITIGLSKGQDLSLRAQLATDRAGRFGHFLKSCLVSRKITPSRIKAGVICSVVPRVNKGIKNAIKGLIAGPVYILGDNLSVPIKNRYAKPKEVGSDRLVCAYMGLRLYGAPVITVDLGTAITFDAVSRDKEYLGGIILAGIGLSLSSLYQQTALLPKIGPAKAKVLIGRNTMASMLSGVTFGFGSLIDGLMDKLKEQLGPGTKTILTGGDAAFIKPYCKRIDYFKPDLVLKGLSALCPRNS